MKEELREEIDYLSAQVTVWGAFIMAHLTRVSGDKGWAAAFFLLGCWVLIRRPLTGFWTRVWKR